MSPFHPLNIVILVHEKSNLGDKIYQENNLMLFLSHKDTKFNNISYINNNLIKKIKGMDLCFYQYRTPITNRILGFHLVFIHM